MGISEEAFPDTADNLESTTKKTLTKLAALWFRIDGLLDRLLTALKHLAALTTRMESRIPRGPPDYPTERQAPWVYYGGSQEPTPREPSWQTSLLGKIVAPLIVLGIPAILVTLWNISSRLTTMEADRTAQEKHLEAHDKIIDEIEREIWPHKR